MDLHLVYPLIADAIARVRARIDRGNGALGGACSCSDCAAHRLHSVVTPE
jgi:hypothetical protein